MARRKFDSYYTAQEMVLELFCHVNIGGHVLEPTAGEGAISSLLEMHPRVKSVFTNDINPVLKTNSHFDIENPEALIWRPLGENAPRRYDWLVTNPPFNIAAQVLKNAWAAGIPNIALLLRLSFLEPTTGRGDQYGRKYLLNELAPSMSHLIVFGSPRPSYTGDGNTDSVTTAWMVWRQINKNGIRPVFVYDWKRDWKRDRVTKDDVLNAVIPF